MLFIFNKGALSSGVDGFALTCPRQKLKKTVKGYLTQFFIHEDFAKASSSAK